MKATTIPFLIGLGLLAGCANHLYFTTSTSVGLDVSGTAQAPNKISFAFQRHEGAIVPKKADGTSHSVLGNLDSEFTWFSGQKVSQLFATGEAADQAAATVAVPDDTEAKPAGAGLPIDAKRAGRGGPLPGDPLVFVTRTTLGLDLSAGEPNVSPHFLFGYKRLETTAIPVPDPAREVRPVYADIHIDTRSGTARPADATGVDQVRIRQAFATGNAAVVLSRRGEVKEKLQKAMQVKYSGSATSERLRAWLRAAPDRAERLRRGQLIKQAVGPDSADDWADLIDDPRHEEARAGFLRKQAATLNIP